MCYLHQVTFASVGFRHVANTYFEGFWDSSNCLTIPKPSPRLQPVIKIEFIILFRNLFFNLNFQIFNAIKPSEFFSKIFFFYSSIALLEYFKWNIKIITMMSLEEYEKENFFLFLILTSTQLTHLTIWLYFTQSISYKKQMNIFYIENSLTSLTYWSIPALCLYVLDFLIFSFHFRVECAFVFNQYIFSYWFELKYERTSYNFPFQ